MSNANQETIADIVADIRAQNQGLPEDSYALSPLVCDLLSFADRIEAAEKREREAALAVSPRNCDRFATLDDARNAFFADYVSDETCSSATAFAIWLYDEAKGVTDGSK